MQLFVGQCYYSGFFYFVQTFSWKGGSCQAPGDFSLVALPFWDRGGLVQWKHIGRWPSASAHVQPELLVGEEKRKTEGDISFYDSRRDRNVPRNPGHDSGARCQKEKCYHVGGSIHRTCGTSVKDLQDYSQCQKTVFCIACGHYDPVCYPGFTEEIENMDTDQDKWQCSFCCGICGNLLCAGTYSHTPEQSLLWSRCISYDSLYSGDCGYQRGRDGDQCHQIQPGKYSLSLAFLYLCGESGKSRENLPGGKRENRTDQGG